MSRFESVVAEVLRKYESVQQQQQQQQQDQRGKRRASARSRKKSGGAQDLVQVPACDSPSTDEAEVAPPHSLEAAEPNAASCLSCTRCACVVS